MPKIPVPLDRLDALTMFDTPTIANAMDSLQIKGRQFSGSSIRAVTAGGKAICGVAITATMKEQWGGNYSHVEPWMCFLEEIEKETLPVVAILKDESEIVGRDAMIGEGMSLAMRSVGAHAALCDGVIRDISAIREINFPVWANGLVADRGNIRFHQYQVPVNVGGMKVNPGDLIHMDENGAMVLPSDRVDEILASAADVNRNEAILFQLLNSTDFRVSQLRNHYAGALKAALAEANAEF